MRERSRAGRVYARRGYWYVDVQIGSERVRRSARKSERKARELLEQLREEATRAAEDRPLTLAELLEAYVRGLRVRGKPASVAQAEVHARILKRHFGDSLDVRRLTRAEVEGFAASRLDAGVQRSSLNGSLRYLRAALRQAVEAGRLEILPANVKLLKVGRSFPRVLDDEAIGRLLAEAGEPFDLILLIAAKAGLRHQEILHLQRANVDLAERVLLVRAKRPSRALPGGWSPKSHASS